MNTGNYFNRNRSFQSTTTTTPPTGPLADPQEERRGFIRRHLAEISTTRAELFFLLTALQGVRAQKPELSAEINVEIDILEAFYNMLFYRAANLVQFPDRLTQQGLLAQSRELRYFRSLSGISKRLSHVPAWVLLEHLVPVEQEIQEMEKEEETRAGGWR